MRTITPLLILFTSACYPAFSAQDTFYFSQGMTTAPISGPIMVMDDSSGTMAVADALVSTGFKSYPAGVPNFEVSRAAHWLRFPVLNDSEDGKLILSVDYAEIDELDVYTIEDGRVSVVCRTGLSVDGPGTAELSDEFAFGFIAPQGKRIEVLLRVRGFKPIHVPVVLSTQEAYARATSERRLFMGAYAGIMLVLVLYNFFLFIATRDRTYFLYVLYVLIISAAQLSFMGIGPATIIGGGAWFASRASIFFALASVLLGMEFARRFIGTRTIVPRLHKIVPVFFVLVGSDMCLYAFGDPWTGYQIAQGLTGMTAIYLMVLGITAARRGSRTARFFLIAWSSFLISVVVFVLKDAGALPFTTLTHYSMTFGSAIEGVLLSFGLADRINILRRDKERSQAEALAALQENERIIRDQNATLEQKVTERTHELVEANEEIKRTQVQLVNAEKMAGLGQLTAGIAHEINNPINFINSNIPPLRRNLQDIVEVLADFRSVKESSSGADLKAAHEKCTKLGLDESIDELDGMIASIDEGARRTAEIVKGLRNFSRLDEDAVKKADINEGIRSTIGLLSPQIKGRVEIHTALAELPQADCHPGKLNQAVMNLLTNAAQAVRARHGDGGDGAVSIRSWHENGMITIAVQDNGCGMEEAVKARIFEPFFTTKGVGEGTGLGLSITYSIVQKHNGTISVDSTPGQGSEFQISIPVVQQEGNIALRA